MRVTTPSTRGGSGLLQAPERLRSRTGDKSARQAVRAVDQQLSEQRTVAVSSLPAGKTAPGVAPAASAAAEPVINRHPPLPLQARKPGGHPVTARIAGAAARFRFGVGCRLTECAGQSVGQLCGHVASGSSTPSPSSAAIEVSYWFCTASDDRHQSIDTPSTVTRISPLPFSPLILNDPAAKDGSSKRPTARPDTLRAIPKGRGKNGERTRILGIHDDPQTSRNLREALARPITARS